MTNRLLSTDRPIAIYYAFITKVNSITKINNSQCQVSLSGDWNLIDTTTGTIEILESNQATAAGIEYSSVINAILPGHDENTPADIANIAGRKVLLRVDYRNGMKKIIGNKTYAPRLFINTASNTTTKRTLQCNFKNTSANLWLS